ncbi:neutral amino acid permease [Fusarium albosuccineum]|uniref:Neutral amino acid permease n=1 Tax=Fusarium albosuccineum TaxID=1237068 RepID=A0A8H4LLN0_9HYPO|nr:neutral amino acid permease [Fusarium albosuccineum]
MSAPNEAIDSASHAEKGLTLDRKDSNKIDHDSGHETGTDFDIKPATSEEVGGVFGGEGGKNLRVMGRWSTLFALLTNQFGIAALGLPSAFRDIGLIPAIITTWGAAALAWYTGYELYRFYCRHPHCITVIDMAKVAGGRTWGIIVAIAFLIQMIMCCASASVTLSIAFNSISDHAMCTVGFIGIATIVSFVLFMPRTMKFVAQSGVPTLISIVGAVLITMISLGISNPVQATEEDWKPQINIVNNPGFRTIFNSVLKIVWAFAGHHAFVSYMAEMRDPVKDFPFALSWLMAIAAAFYSFLAIGIYCLAGEYTTSPALGSAPRIPAKVAYGVVIPAILTAALANGHIGIKYVFVVAMRKMNALNEITANTPRAWGTWLGTVTVFWLLSFILSNAIPIFDSLVSIQSATTYAWFSFRISGALWLSWNKGSYFRDWKQKCFFCLNVSIIGWALFLNGCGLWSSITEMLDIFASGGGVSGSFSCGDNASL